jgi:hypothetical protein
MMPDGKQSYGYFIGSMSVQNKGKSKYLLVVAIIYVNGIINDWRIELLTTFHPCTVSMFISLYHLLYVMKPCLVY